jgi:hypothetical protein
MFVGHFHSCLTFLTFEGKLRRGKRPHCIFNGKVLFFIYIFIEVAGNTKGMFDRFGISCMTTDNFCFYLQNRLIQTSQTEGQRYSNTSPFSIPWRVPLKW